MEYKFTVQGVGLCMAANVNVLAWGLPGEGKSTAMQAIAAQNNLHLETVIASIRDASDFNGIPGIENGESFLVPPVWAMNIIKQAKGQNEQGRPRASMILFDEISTAVPTTQAALLRPLLERVVGDIKIPDATRMVAAANPPDIAAGGWDLAPPTANRFVHIDWALSAKDVRDGFILGFPKIEIPRLPNKAVQDKNIRAAKALVGSFVGARPMYKSRMPEHFSGSSSKKKTFSGTDYAFPTPRSWEVAATIYAAATSARFRDGSSVDKSVITMLIEGTVGVEAATEFLAYVKNLSLPDPEDVLVQGKDFVIPKKGDQLFAILGGVTHVIRDDNSVQRWQAYGDVLSAVVNSEQADVAFVFARDWIENLRPEGAIIKSEHRVAFSRLFKELDPEGHKQWTKE